MHMKIIHQSSDLRISNCTYVLALHCVDGGDVGESTICPIDEGDKDFHQSYAGMDRRILTTLQTLAAITGR